jgi:hypothetical protein
MSENYVCSKCGSEYFIIQWSGYLTGTIKCLECQKTEKINVIPVKCNVPNIKCGYRLDDGTCVPISRYGRLFTCFEGR